MSHPVPGHSYGENEYPSDSPHKDIQGGAYHRALKKAKGRKVPKASKTVAGWAKHLRKVIKDNS